MPLQPGLTGTRDGKTVAITVDHAEHQGSRHAKISCAQCHAGASPAATRPCSTITTKVDCSVCHQEVVATYRGSTHAQLAAKGSPDAPGCRDCHGAHGVQGRVQTHSPTYARNIPVLCGQCHRGSR